MAKSIASLMQQQAAEKSPLGLQTEVIISVPPEFDGGIYNLKLLGLHGDNETHAIEFTIEE
jgi:hypothetical protein